MPEASSSAACGFIPMSGLERKLVVSALALLTVGIGTVNLLQVRPDLATVWLAFVVYVLTLMLPFCFYRRDWGWLHPVMFTVLWVQVVRYILPRVGVFASGLDTHQAILAGSFGATNEVVAQATLLTAVGLLAFYAAFLGKGPLAAPRVQFRPPRGVLLKVTVVAAVALFALYRLAQEAGGIGQLMLFRGLSGDARQAFIAEVGGRHWHYLVGILKPACFVWLALRPSDWRRPAFLGFFGLALAIGYVATGSRSGIIVPVLMVLAIWMLSRQRVSYRAILAGALCGLIIIGVGGEFRTQSRGAKHLSDVQLDLGFVEGLSRGVETAVQYGTETDGTYGILARVPDEVGLLYGRSYLSILFAPIPSALLPFEKPEAGGKLNAIHIFGNPNTAIPPGNVGEAYWNFHVPGVVLVMFAFGLVLKWFSRLYVVNGGVGWVAITYVITLFSLQPNSPAVFNWVQLIVPTSFFVVVFCGLPRNGPAYGPPLHRTVFLKIDEFSVGSAEHRPRLQSTRHTLTAARQLGGRDKCHRLEEQ